MYDFVKKQHRDLLGEAVMDMRSYSADPYATQRLVENKPGVGVPIGGAKVPHVLRIEQVEGKWFANDRQYGPFDSIRDLEIAVLGRSDLSAAKRIGATALGRPMNNRPG
jgi:hypothetical protein